MGCVQDPTGKLQGNFTCGFDFRQSTILAICSRFCSPEGVNATVIFLHPLKTPENLWFSDVFRGYRKKPVA